MSDEELLPEALRADRRRFRRTGIYDAAAWYDVDYSGYRGEMSFYRTVLEAHGEDGFVVELGAGTGRLAIPFAQAGFRLHAVEPAADMRRVLLEKCRAADVRIDVEDALASSFVGPPSAAAVVYFPFNGLLHVTSRAALAASFDHVHRRLADRGRFAFDITGPYWETLLRGSVGWGRVDERVHPVSGRRFLTCDRARYDGATRITRIDIRYAWVDGDDEGLETVLYQHMWTYPEVLSCLEDCGFVVEDRFGDVDFSPFFEGSPRLMVCARKA